VKFKYCITDPSGTEHYVIGELAYDNLIEALRQQHGELCELLVRAQILTEQYGADWRKHERELAA
jgi:hypothetical protein